MLRKNTKNRPGVEDLLFYEDTIVKAGATLLGADLYKNLISAKKRIINEVDWFKDIKNNKMLGSYLSTLASMYKSATPQHRMIHSTAELSPNHRRIKAEDIIEYGEPNFSINPKQKDPRQETSGRD